MIDCFTSVTHNLFSKVFVKCLKMAANTPQISRFGFCDDQNLILAVNRKTIQHDKWNCVIRKFARDNKKFFCVNTSYLMGKLCGICTILYF